jgi:hypothetical protein
MTVKQPAEGVSMWVGKINMTRDEWERNHHNFKYLRVNGLLATTRHTYDDILFQCARIKLTKDEFAYLHGLVLDRTVTVLNASDMDRMYKSLFSLSRPAPERKLSSWTAQIKEKIVLSVRSPPAPAQLQSLQLQVQQDCKIWTTAGRFWTQDEERFVLCHLWV